MLSDVTSYTTYVTKSVKLPQELKKKQLSPKQNKFLHFRRGNLGEKIAQAHLKQKGYLIIDSNVLLQKKEIDIVCLDQDNDELVFVEVKTRLSSKHGHPSEAVNKQKLKKLAEAARQFCRYKRLAKPYRFDIISVLPGKVEHFENVTWP